MGSPKVSLPTLMTLLWIVWYWRCTCLYIVRFYQRIMWFNFITKYTIDQKIRLQAISSMWQRYFSILMIVKWKTNNDIVYWNKNLLWRQLIFSLVLIFLWIVFDLSKQLKFWNLCCSSKLNNHYRLIFVRVINSSIHLPKIWKQIVGLFA